MALSWSHSEPNIFYKGWLKICKTQKIGKKLLSV
jgi:hypothetical protein